MGTVDKIKVPLNVTEIVDLRERIIECDQFGNRLNNIKQDQLYPHMTTRMYIQIGTAIELPNMYPVDQNGATVRVLVGESSTLPLPGCLPVY
ncbi:hypothetical protein SeLEV6574_g08629 [Synchytrium endobioticum]|uniref:Uncharacterized protein n=1 Tax=Synchytrium endobioticum TaxID=286115 RepID=A0A507BGP7_9FUNG|nr:hypothetical protein SeLEV6574_g08629 [Synchytrium endobioticum]